MVIFDFFANNKILVPLLSSEFSLCATIFFTLIAFFFKGNGKAFPLSFIISIAGLSISGFLSVRSIPTVDLTIFGGFYSINKHNGIAKFVSIISVGLVEILLLFSYLKKDFDNRGNTFELLALMNFSLLGIVLTISSNNLLILYLSTELFTLPLYVMAALEKNNGKSLEAALKYFTFSVFSSMIMLYGISLIYINTGSINFSDIALLYGAPDLEISRLAVCGMVMILGALLFKLGSAPLHFWLPDVYEGVHSVVLAFYSITPKFASTIALYNLYNYVFLGPYRIVSTKFLAFFCVTSFIIGAIGAIRQTNLKRLLAYSAIMNSGFVILDILGDIKTSFMSLIVYTTSYAIANYGIIAVSLSIWEEKQASNPLNFELSALSGISRRRSFSAFALSIFLLSLAGIPPFVGFLGKLDIFITGLAGGFTNLVLIGIFASVVSLVYYISIIKNMYFTDNDPHTAIAVGNKTFKAYGLAAAALSLISFFILSQVSEWFR